MSSDDRDELIRVLEASLAEAEQVIEAQRRGADLRVQAVELQAVQEQARAVQKQDGLLGWILERVVRVQRQVEEAARNAASQTDAAKLAESRDMLAVMERMLTRAGVPTRLTPTPRVSEFLAAEYMKAKALECQSAPKIDPP